MTKKYLIGNWKANLNLAEVEQFVQDWRNQDYQKEEDKVVAIAVPAIFYAYLYEKKPDFSVALQDISIFAENGTHTGEVTAENLKGIEPEFAVIGHSERRAQFGETNEVIWHKAQNLIRIGTKPIICVDLDQIQEMAHLLEKTPTDKYIIAYEPLDAIGSGKNLQGELLRENFAFLRKIFAPGVPILYGGSVKGVNAAEYSEVADGLLVGGASLKAETWMEVVKNF